MRSDAGGNATSTPAGRSELERSRRFWQAGLIYAAMGLAIMAVALGDPQMLRPERRLDLVRLMAGLPVVALIAVCIAYGDRGLAWLLRLFGLAGDRARRAGRRVQRWFVRLLTVFVFIRFLLGLASAFGYSLTLGGIETAPIRADVSIWLPPAMMSAIVIMLFRAGWYRPTHTDSG